ncbi:MAG: hypothetical protein K2Z81_09325, partial [Cyanobacteria bacterium]|nr:hypothetical protein [Cyanobacteriota bacterium]
MSSSLFENFKASAWELLEEASKPVLELAKEAWETISGDHAESRTGENGIQAVEGKHSEAQQPEQQQTPVAEQHTASGEHRTETSQNGTRQSESSGSDQVVRQATATDLQELTNALRNSLPSIDLYTNVAATIMGGAGHLLNHRSQAGATNVNLTRLGEHASLTSQFSGKEQTLNDNHLQWAIDDALRCPLYQAVT